MKKNAQNETVKAPKGGNDLTELVFILDRSGSMAGLEGDTIGGFNSMIEKQRGEEGRALVTTVLFDGVSEVLHDRVELTRIERMTEKDYFVRGCTALLDALGSTITHIKSIHRYARGEDVPASTLFIITTDGMENASREYGVQKVRALIEERKKAGWEFLFLGANIDAIGTAKSFGIDEDRAVEFLSDSAGTALNYAVMSEAISDVRRKRTIGAKWKARIVADCEARRDK